MGVKRIISPSGLALEMGGGRTITDAIAALQQADAALQQADAALAQQLLAKQDKLSLPLPLSQGGTGRTDYNGAVAALFHNVNASSPDILYGRQDGGNNGYVTTQQLFDRFINANNIRGLTGWLIGSINSGSQLVTSASVNLTASREVGQYSALSSAGASWIVYWTPGAAFCGYTGNGGRMSYSGTSGAAVAIGIR